MPFEDAQAFFFGGKEEFVGSNNFFLLVSIRRISWWHYFKITRRLSVIRCIMFIVDRHLTY